MSSIFNSENKFFRFFARAMDVVLLSLIWTVLCLPLFTMGAATAALYDTTVKCVREYDAATYTHFYRAFRKNLRIGIPTGLIFLALTFLLVRADGLLFGVAEKGTAGYALYASFSIIMLFLMGTATYLFPLMSRFESNVKQLFVNSLFLSIAHLPSTICMGALLGMTIWAHINWWFPFTFLPCCLMLVDSFFLERIFRPYMPKEEVEDEAEMGDK